MSATTPITIDAINPPKPLQDKYDRRKPRKRGPYRKLSENSSGPKPQWMHAVNRNSAHYVLKVINDLETWPQLFEWATEREDARLCFDILCYLTDRRDGKPFVAINPLAVAKPTTINDNRIQTAIGTLLTTAKPSLPASDPALSQSAALATVGLDATATSNNVIATVTPATLVPSKRPRRPGGPK